MRLLYDNEDDVLDVIFDERLHRSEKIAYRLRDGIVLYMTVESFKPVQMTLVNYRRLAQMPVVHFNGWQALAVPERNRLFSTIASSAVSTFLKLDPQTGYGHLASPDILEMFSVAA